MFLDSLLLLEDYLIVLSQICVLSIYLPIRICLRVILYQSDVEIGTVRSSFSKKEEKTKKRKTKNNLRKSKFHYSTLDYLMVIEGWATPPMMSSTGQHPLRNF